MKISFEIDKDVYVQALINGWEERFGDELISDEITITPNPIDLTCALSKVYDTDITNVKIDEG